MFVSDLKRTKSVSHSMTITRESAIEDALCFEKSSGCSDLIPVGCCSMC